MPPIPAALSLDGLPGDARQAFDLASASGYAGIAIPTDHAELSPEQLGPTARRHVLRLLSSQGLTIQTLRVATPRGPEGGAGGLTDPATIDRTLDAASQALTLARELGVQTLSLAIGSLATSKVSESTLISALRDLSQRADAAGIALALGADSTEKLASLLKNVDFDRARMDLSGARLIGAGVDPLQIARDYAGHIGQFSATDAVRAGHSLRLVELGAGQLPLAEMLELLHEQGFAGPTVVDIRGTGDPDTAARHAAEVLRRALR